VINGFVLERDAAEDVFRTLATESNTDRAFNPGLHPERVSLIVGGLCVLVAVMRRLVISEIIMSEADLLDGIVVEVRAS
jgi:exopolyphosphatase/guanosine-5'-triphosphate,3'-diphosphate pyrophosphatase